ncbi:hypothetical protein BGX28_006137 [Mortierella sp. GBA30]|nr:hypothetical protein BGX28_006137 [Mortierella sp. GBA30]
MHALRSSRLVLSKHGDQSWDSQIASFMIRLLYSQHQYHPTYHIPRIPIRSRVHIASRSYHSASVAGITPDQSTLSCQHATTEKNRPTITSFLAPPGTERPYNPYETIADSIKGKDSSQTVFSGRVPSDLDPVSPNVMMHDAIGSRNAQQVWHTYMRLIKKQDPTIPLFPASTYYKTLRCFQATRTAETAQWALKVYDDMKTHHWPKIPMLNTMLDIIIRHRDVDWAIEFFHKDAALFQLSPTSRSYNIMIRGLAANGQLKAAQRIYSDLRTGTLPVRPDVSTYSTLMSIYANRGMQNEADRMLDEMSKDGVKPNMWIFNSVIKRCVNRKDYSGARKVMALMRDAEMQPDVITYSTLIDGHAKDGNEEAIAEIQGEMAVNQVYPNPKTITSTVKVFARSGLHSDIDTQLEAVLRSLPQGEMNDLTFGVLMNVYGKRKDLDAAMDIFNHINAKGRPVNDVILNSLLDGYVRADQVPTANKIFHDHFTARNIRPTTNWTYNIMIAGCCKQGNLNNALHYYHEMNSYQIQPDTWTYSRLIQLYLEHHQLDNAQRMVRLMRNANMDVSVQTYTMLMDYMSNTKDIRGALRYYQEMLDLGIQADVHCYTVLINAQIRARNYAGCNLIYERMLKAGVRPTLQTLTSMIHVHAEQGDLEKVKEHWQAITDSGLLPDLKAFTTLMHSYGRQGNVEMVEFIYKDISRKQIKSDAIMLTTLISAYCSLPRLNVGRIEEISSMLEALELDPTPEYFKVLFDAYGRHGMPDRVVKTWRQFRGLEKPLNWVPTTSNLLYLIEACRDRGYVDVLQAVWRVATLGSSALLSSSELRHGDQLGSGTSKMNIHRPKPEVFTAYLNALLTHNRFSEIETLLDKGCRAMRIMPRTEDFELLFTGLAQYGFLKKELDNMRQIVLQRWPSVMSMIDKIVENTRKI